MMTKKHYIKLAELIKKHEVGTINPKDKFIEYNDFLWDLCEILKDDNPNFSKETFRRACQ